jgi:hypothetical protein
MVWIIVIDIWSQVCSPEAFRVTLLLNFLFRAQVLGIPGLSKGIATLHNGQHAYAIYKKLHAFMDKPSVAS